MNVTTKFTLLACALTLTIGGCARTSPDRAPPRAPDDDPSYTEPLPDPVIDSVGNSEDMKPTPGSDRPSPETQDIGNPGGNLDKPIDPQQPDDTIGPNTDPNPNNPGVPPPTRH